MKAQLALFIALLVSLANGNDQDLAKLDIQRELRNVMILTQGLKSTVAEQVAVLQLQIDAIGGLIENNSKAIQKVNLEISTLGQLVGAINQAVNKTIQQKDQCCAKVQGSTSQRNTWAATSTVTESTTAATKLNTIRATRRLSTTSSKPKSPPPVIAKKCPTAAYTKYKNSCYRVGLTLVPWKTALNRCQAQGAHLVTIETGEENSFLYNLIAKTRGKSMQAFWIGGNDQKKEGVFRWNPSEAKIQYTNWLIGEPNNMRNEDCILAVYAALGQLKWVDFACTTSQFFICEKNLA